VSAGEVKVHRVNDPSVEIAGVKLTPRSDTDFPVGIAW
jgi:hypothetical protein